MLLLQMPLFVGEACSVKHRTVALLCKHPTAVGSLGRNRNWD